MCVLHICHLQLLLLGDLGAEQLVVQHLELELHGITAGLRHNG